MAEQGTPTLTYDYRGVGGSRGKSIRGLIASIQDWGSKDCAAALGWAHDRFPSAEVLVVGHSIGCVVTGFVEKPPEIAKMLFVSPHTGYWKEYAPWARRTMFLKWHVLMPAITSVWGYFPGRLLGFPEDLPFAVAMEWAFRNRLGSRRRRQAKSKNLRDAPWQMSGTENFSHIRSAILAVRPEDDPFATEASARRVSALFCNSTFSDIPVSNSVMGRKVGHMGFFLKASRETLWRPTLDWLNGAVLNGTRS